MKFSEVEPFLMAGFTIEDISSYPAWQYKIVCGNLWGRIKNSILFSWGKLEYSYDALKVRENNIWQVPGVDTTKLTRDQAIILMDAGYKVTNYACIGLEGQPTGYYFKSLLNNKIYYQTTGSNQTFTPNFFDENRAYKLLDNQPIEKPMNKTFDFNVALNHMKSCKKVTCDNYPAGDHFYINEAQECQIVRRLDDQYIVGYSPTSNDILHGKWSLYEEPKKELNLFISDAWSTSHKVVAIDNKDACGRRVLLAFEKDGTALIYNNNIQAIGYKLKVVD